jgi:hypothetical protein
MNCKIFRKKKKLISPRKRMSGSAIAIAWYCINATLMGVAPLAVGGGRQPRKS